MHGGMQGPYGGMSGQMGGMGGMQGACIHLPSRARSSARTVWARRLTTPPRAALRRLSRRAGGMGQMGGMGGQMGGMGGQMSGMGGQMGGARKVRAVAGAGAPRSAP